MSKGDTSQRVDVWMPLYVKDYLAATSRLTTEQHGAYLLLIMDYWMNGPLPDDDAALSQIARLSPEQWSKHRASIERLFRVHQGEWLHNRIEKERKAAADRRKQAQERGKLGAKARWAKENEAGNGTSIEQASDKQSSKDSSAPAPAQKEKSKPLSACADRFDDFWSSYPKKVKKAEARKKWKAKRLDEKADHIIADIRTRKTKDRRWLDGYVPDPTTYINGERWDDEIETAKDSEPQSPSLRVLN